MKRKLISFQELSELKQNSLSSDIKELTEAKDYLAQALGETGLELVSYNDGDFVFETADGEYIQGKFSVNNGQILLDNIEKLVIDDVTEKEKRIEILENVLESVLDDDTATADKLMSDYISIDINSNKRERGLSESSGRVRLYGTRGVSGKPKLFVRKGSKDPAKSRAAKKGHVRHPSSYRRGAAKRKRQLSRERMRRQHYKSSYGILRARSGGTQYTGTRKKRMFAEWKSLSENVFGYIDFIESKHIFAETLLETNTDGALSVKMPVAEKRNMGKVLTMQYDLLKTDLKVMRENAHRLPTNKEFCSMIADSRRQHALGDDNGLDESITSIADKFPGVLYLTPEELAETIAESLEFSGVNTFDDNVCKLLADGIRRSATELYPDRVNKILKVEGVEAGDDVYETLTNAVISLYPKLDEASSLENKLFEDLKNTTIEIGRLARESGNEAVFADAKNFSEELEDVLNGRQPKSLDLAEEVAGWIEELAETNMESESWDVIKEPFRTTAGDNPILNKYAQQPYTPSKDFSGDWGSAAPVSDGKNYKGDLADEMQNKGLGNKGKNQVWPELENPYSLKSDKFTMANDEGVDKDEDALGFYQDDTFPMLNNPYLPKSQMNLQMVDVKNRV